MSAPMARPFDSPPLLRSTLLSLLRLVLRLRASPLKTPTSLLVIVPHPDDECLGCGGLIARTRAAGGRVRLLFLTEGENATGTPDASLGKVRCKEAAQAAARLGVPDNDLHWLGLPDSRLDKLSAAQAESFRTTLLALLESDSTDLVAVSSVLDGSSEHIAAAQLSWASLQAMPNAPALLGYLVWTAWSPTLLWRLLFTRWPVCILGLDPETRTAKCEALACHQSQLRPGKLGATFVLPRGFAATLCARQEFFIKEGPLEVPSRQAKAGCTT